MYKLACEKVLSNNKKNKTKPEVFTIKFLLRQFFFKLEQFYYNKSSICIACNKCEMLKIIPTVSFLTLKVYKLRKESVLAANWLGFLSGL